MKRTYVRPAAVGVPYALVIVALLIGALAIPGFVSLSHLGSMTSIAAYLGIIAVGQTFVLLLGGIDLSIPFMLNLAAVVLTGLNVANASAGSDIAIVLAIGLGVGLMNGLGIALLDISPLVMTLGMNTVLEGVTLIYTGGSPKGYAPSVAVTLATGSTEGLPNVVILWIVLALVMTGVLVFTKFGRHVYSVGSNRLASEYSALPVRSTLVAAYVISALSATLGGILLTGYSGQAYLGMGTNYLLASIAVVVIGGTSIYGGKGSYLQTVAGALMITFIESALVTIQAGQAGQDVLYGTIILLMAGFNEVAVRHEARGWHGRTLGWARGWLTPIRDQAGGATTAAGSP